MSMKLLLFLGASLAALGARGAEIPVNNGSDPLFPTPPPIGSLRHALSIAQPGDTIRLARSLIVNLQEDVTVLPGLDGLVITGPEEGEGTAQIRAKIEGGDFKTQLEVIKVRSDKITIRNLTFRDLSVSVGYPGARAATITGVKVQNCLFTKAGLLDFDNVIMGLVELNRFELTQSVSGGNEALSFAWTSGCIARKNKFEGGVKVEGIASLSDVNLTLEENVGTGDYYIQPKTATLRKNVLTNSRLRVDTFSEVAPGHVLIEENECGVLHTQGVNMTLRKNKVSGKVRVKKDGVPVTDSPEEEVFTAMNVLGVDPDATGPITVLENEVSGGIVGLKVGASSTVTQALVQGNTINDARFQGLTIVQEVPMTLFDNTLNRCGTFRLKGIPGSGICLRARTPDIIVEQNKVNDSGAAAIRVLTGEPLLKNNTLTGGIGAGIVAEDGTKAELEGNTITKMGKGGVVLFDSAEVDATGLVLKENGTAGIIVNGGATLRSTGATIEKSKGPGIVFRSEGKGTITGGAINGSTGPGVSLEKNATADIRGTVFSGNKGPGIDLAPAGVTLNSKPKQANGDIDFPDDLEFDASARLIRGTVEAGAIVQLFKVADGKAKGDKAHGEGAVFIGETIGTTNGLFAIAPGAAQEGDFFTLTATRPGAQPVTSEFSENIEVDPTPPIEIVSVSSAEASGDGRSVVNEFNVGPPPALVQANRSVSANARFVLFHSLATNLVGGDTNNAGDLFLRDRTSGTTERVNVDSAGNQATDTGPPPRSGNGSLSADGRWVVFTSSAPNLVAEDLNSATDIFLRDLQTGTTTAITDPSKQPDMTVRRGGFDCSISADGNVVAFVTEEDLFTNVGPGFQHVLVWTRSTGQFEEVSVPQDGTSNFMACPRLSADGRFVAFETRASLVASDADTRSDVYLRDRQTGTTDRLSVGTDGTALGGNIPAISADGRFVAFSTSTSSDPADTNGQADIYVRDRQASTTTWASQPPAGLDPTLGRDCKFPSISDDGRYIAYQATGKTERPGEATVLVEDIYVRDRQRGLTVEVSLGAGGDARGRSRYPVLTADGKNVVFESDADGLTPDDANVQTDVFIRAISGDFPE